jgi:spermidine/putrescine-binding protein
MEQGVIDGQQYFIPLDWGFIAPIVNLDHVDVQEETFGILFDDRYEGRISWVDTSNMMYIGGLYLGVPDPFNMTDEELVEVRDFLISKKHLVRNMWNSSYEFAQDFLKEEIWIGYAWPDTVGYADYDGMNYLYMTPKEGRVSWVCGLGLASDTQNYRHSHAYVDSWASTRAAEFLLAWYFYGHTNKEADLSVVSPGIVEALGLDDLTVLDPPKAIPESYIPRRDVYQQYWAEVQAA